MKLRDQWCQYLPLKHICNKMCHSGPLQTPLGKVAHATMKQNLIRASRPKNVQCVTLSPGLFIFGILLQEMSDTKQVRSDTGPPRSVQVWIVAQILGAITMAATAIYLSYKYLNLKQYKFNDVGERLAFTLQWQALSLAMMVAGIQAVALTRLTTKAIDPLSAQDQDPVAVHSRYLTNTTEQFIISLVGQLMLTTYLSDDQMKIIPILVVTFVIARILFWIGYLDNSEGHSNRAFGLAVTFFVTFVPFGYCVYKLIGLAVTFFVTFVPFCYCVYKLFAQLL